MAKYTDGDKIDVIAATISSIMPPPPHSSSTPVLFPGCRIFHFAASDLVRNSPAGPNSCDYSLADSEIKQSLVTGLLYSDVAVLTIACRTRPLSLSGYTLMIAFRYRAFC